MELTNECKSLLESPAVAMEFNSEEMQFCCDRCGEAFAEEESFRRHLSLSHAEQITEAPGDLRDIERPFVELDDDPTSNVQTGEGEAAAEVETNQWSDQMEHGSTDVALHCDKCGKSFRVKRRLDSHVCVDAEFVSDIRKPAITKRYEKADKVIEKRKYVPDQNFSEASKAAKLQLEKHPDELELKIFTCQECFEEFSSKPRLHKHILSHKKAPDLDDSRVQEDEVMSDVKVAQIQEKSEVNLEHIEAKLFKCEICGQSFCQKMMLEAHRDAIHYGMKHRCNACGIDFKRRSNFVRHNIRSHSDLTYKCDKCPKAFVKKYDLERHMKAHCAKENNTKDVIQCADCDMVFVYKKDLKIHRRESHKVVPQITDEQPIVIPDYVIKEHGAVTVFRCSLCPRAFSLKTDLQRHFLVHSGEKPFACDLCDSKFNRKSNLVRHRKLMHRITESRPMRVKTELGDRRRKRDRTEFEPWEEEIRRQDEEVMKWKKEQREAQAQLEEYDEEERNIYWEQEVKSDQEGESFEVAYFKPDDKITVRILTFE